jgi:hypothetical protein
MNTRTSQTVEQYFSLPDTPAQRSPVGKLMARVLEKNPAMTFEDARRESHRLLDIGAGRKHYSIPAVLSPAERAELTARFKQFKLTREAA